jgi:hypothetical protein
MNNYVKILSLSLTLTASVFMQNASATVSTNLLLKMAEKKPALIDRLSDLAEYKPEQLAELLEMVDSNINQVEKLLNLSEENPELFNQLLKIKRVSTQSTKKTPTIKIPENNIRTFGTIEDPEILQN